MQIVAIAAQGEAVHGLDGGEVEHAVRLAAAAGDAAVGVELPDLRQAATGRLAALAARGVGTRTSGGRLARLLAEQPGGKRADAAQGHVARGVAHQAAARDRRLLVVHFFSPLLLEFFSKMRTFAARPSSTSTRPWRSAARSAGVSVNCDGPATTVWKRPVAGIDLHPRHAFLGRHEAAVGQHGQLGRVAAAEEIGHRRRSLAPSGFILAVVRKAFDAQQTRIDDVDQVIGSRGQVEVVVR